MNRYLSLVIMFMLPFLLKAQIDFYSLDQVHKELLEITKNDKNSKLETIGKSYGGKDIWILKIQNDHSIKLPAIIIVGGVDGKHPTGSAMTLELAKLFSNNSSDSIQKILDEKAVWFVPVLNPDALANLSSNPTVLRSGNNNVYDSDRDGRTNEDPYEDLNKDGIITQMRVKSHQGQYLPHPEHPNLLVKAKTEQGEMGTYLLLTEGIDNDFDGRFNEDDQKDGVNIDRNFTYNYKAFGEGAGAYAASEPETKAFMDLINENDNVYAVFHIGLQNNLSFPEKYDAKSAKERIIGSWLENDVLIAAHVSDNYKKATASLTNAPAMEKQNGSLTNTVYYHAGRFSFATPGWWVPSTKDSTKSSKSNDNSDVNLYQWLTKENIEKAILPWKEIQHVDFPNLTVEIGGINEYFKHNPPVKYTKASAEVHFPFFTSFLAKMPKLTIEQPQVENLGDNIFRVTTRIINTGDLPTHSEMGDKIRFVSKPKSKLEPSKNQKIISGKTREVHPSLKPGGHIEMSWIIQGKGKSTLTIDCASTGIESIEIEVN